MASLEREILLDLEIRNHAGKEGPGQDAMLRQINRFYCGLQGHDNLKQFSKHRVFLRCATCGYESPGWIISDAAPKAVAAASSMARRLLNRPNLTGNRRAA